MCNRKDYLSHEVILLVSYHPLCSLEKVLLTGEVNDWSICKKLFKKMFLGLKVFIFFINLV